MKMHKKQAIIILLMLFVIMSFALLGCKEETYEHIDNLPINSLDDIKDIEDYQTIITVDETEEYYNISKILEKILVKIISDTQKAHLTN